VSLHPAGHLLGSAQIRIEVAGRVAVVSGDYKRQPDPTCVPFEVVPCDLFVTESTFGLPVFRWPSPESVFDSIHRWWRENQAAGRTSLMMAYALGKSQRLLAGLDASIGPICLHGAVHGPTQLYRNQGVSLPETFTVSEAAKDFDWSRCLVLAVPSAQGTPWLRRFGEVSTAMASGWMAIRGTRRRRAVDRGFVMSDHVDWPSLLQTVKETSATTVWVTHGFSNVVARYLREHGLSPGNTLDASPLETQFQGDAEDSEEISSSPEDETGS
jgi:putative mRNA 3-end processing factor